MRETDRLLALKVQSGHNGLDTKEVGGSTLRDDWNMTYQQESLEKRVIRANAISKPVR